jgi:hypothetical protein
LSQADLSIFSLLGGLLLVSLSSLTPFLTRLVSIRQRQRKMLKFLVFSLMAVQAVMGLRFAMYIDQ